VVVSLFHLAVGTSCRDDTVIGVDVDDLVAGPEVDVPLLAELLGVTDTRSSRDWISPLM